MEFIENSLDLMKIEYLYEANKVKQAALTGLLIKEGDKVSFPIYEAV